MKNKEHYINYYKQLNGVILLSKDGVIWESSPFTATDIKKAAFWAHLQAVTKNKPLGNFDLFR